MRKLIVSIHSTANNIVTGPPSGDETDFVQWAHPGIEDSLDKFLISLDGVDTIVLGRGTYEDLVRKWAKVKEATKIFVNLLVTGARGLRYPACHYNRVITKK